MQLASHLRAGALGTEHYICNSHTLYDSWICMCVCAEVGVDDAWELNKHSIATSLISAGG